MNDIKFIGKNLKREPIEEDDESLNTPHFMLLNDMTYSFVSSCTRLMKLKLTNINLGNNIIVDNICYILEMNPKMILLNL